MRGLMDLMRLGRSVLGFSGRYKAASAVGLIIAVSWIVFGLSSGAYADECDPVTPTAAGCGTEEKPYVVKPPGTDPFPVEPQPGTAWAVSPADGSVFEVQVLNPTAAAGTVFSLENEQFAAILGALGFVVAASAASLFVQIGAR